MSSQPFLDSVRATIQILWHDEETVAAPADEPTGDAKIVALPARLLDWVLEAVWQSPYLPLPTLTCEATGGDGSDAVPVAAAWHLLHAAAHLLDDIMDGEVPDLDPAQATNAAVALVFLAQMSLTTLRQSRVPPERIVDLIAIFNRATLWMSAGQASDLAWGDRATLDDYWRIVAAKSGAFFALACRAGAMLGTQPEVEIAHYDRFGHHLGVLLQVADDLRAVWRPRGRGDLSTLGRTLPVVYARAVAPAEIRSQLQALTKRVLDDKAALAELQTLLRDPAIDCERSQGVVHYVTVQAGFHHQQAREALLATARRDVAHDELLRRLDRVLPALALD